MKNYLLLAILPIFLVSCKQQASEPFSKDGVSFIVPADWKIDDEENFDDVAYYVSIEKNGFDASGLFVFVWIEDSLALDQHIMENQNELKADPIYDNVNLTFEPIRDSTFKGIPSRTSHFTFGLMGFKHEGTMHAFYGTNRTYYILNQGALEHITENTAGFTAIESSFVGQ